MSYDFVPENLFAMLPPFVVQQKVRDWLLEDVPSFDVGGMVVGDKMEQAVMLCKSNGVLAGVPFVNAVFKELGCEVEWFYEEGQELLAPVKVGIVKGSASKILIGERLSLNILSRASGVASISRRAYCMAKTAYWKGQVAGTRKTTPGFRLVEKYSLSIGGAAQHRHDLSSMVMLKDNHIWSASGDVIKVFINASTMVFLRTGCDDFGSAVLWVPSFNLQLNAISSSKD